MSRVEIRFRPLLFIYNLAQEAVGHLKGTADTQRRDGRRRAGKEEKTGRGWRRWRRNGP